MQLAEEFRPRSWGECVGQDKVIAKLTGLAVRGLGGRAYLISGDSGTGKTTIGRLIAESVASPLAITESNARDLKIETIETIERRFWVRAVAPEGQPTGWAWIFNEVHLFGNPIVTRLLTTLEPGFPLPPHIGIVFTTTQDGREELEKRAKDFGPLLSRCCDLPLSRRDLCKPFAERLVKCCRAAGLLNGHSDDYYLSRAVKLMKAEGNNLRAGFQKAELGYLTDAEGGAE